MIEERPWAPEPPRDRKAFKEAESERQGATALIVPEDLAAVEVEGRPLRVNRPRPTAPSISQVARAVEVIDDARAPIVLAGAGVSREGASLELVRMAERLNLPADRWLFCFQSAGRSPEPWLGPQIEDVIVELAQAGEKRLLVVPIGFVCDHVEVLYDIDIESRQLAEAHGARLERSESLNASPAFIDALADIVESKT